MKEKNLQCLFRNWLKANWKSSAAFELKICKEDRFYLGKIAEHQLANLELANKGLFFWKLADLGLQNSFDCFTLYQVPAYVVIFFYKPWKPKRFFMIPITTIQTIINHGDKSINEEVAAKIAEVVGELK
jgi:penicillin-binding protein-related factor A (putative recombinase)